MVSLANRVRLLGSAALGLGLTVVATSPAQAACVAGSGTITCSSTTTTDTVGFGPNDRAWVLAGPLAVTTTISPGAVVDGYGHAIVHTGNAPSVVNSGSVIVNAGNTPTAGGGDGAVYISTNDFLASYSGAGTISNLGTGDGLEVAITGLGSVNINTTGAISAANGIGVHVTNLATSGATSITTGAVTGLAGGIHAILNNTAGNLTVVSNGLVTGGAGIGQDALRIQLVDRRQPATSR